MAFICDLPHFADGFVVAKEQPALVAGFAISATLVMRGTIFSSLLILWVLEVNFWHCQFHLIENSVSANSNGNHLINSLENML